MKKKQSNFHKFPIVLSVFVAITVLILYVLQLNPNGEKRIYNSQQMYSSSTFTSKNLKFSVTVSNDYLINEKYTSIMLKNNLGEIKINRIGTNFSNLNDYLQDLEVKNKLQIINKETFKVGGLDIIKGIINHTITKVADEKAYFIYSNNWSVYSFSTSSPALFDDLDQIVRSFRYTP